MTKTIEERKIEPWASGFTRKEMRQLLWWACIGIAKSQSGAYEKTVPTLIEQIAKEIKVKLPCKPEFNSKLKQWRKTVKKRENLH